VALAAGGAEAWECARRRPPAVVLLELGPGTAGGEALAQHLGTLAGPPALVVLGGALDSRERAARLGAAVYLDMPFSPATLLAAVNDLLRPAGGPALDLAAG
jgi:DNA-binding response OmpR family regulator